MDPRLSELLRDEQLYDDAMIGEYLEALHRHPQINERRRSITHPVSSARDDREAIDRSEAIKRLTCDRRVKPILRSRVQRTGRRYLKLMVVLGLTWVVVGVAARLGLPHAELTTIAGNGLIFGGTSSVLVGLGIYAYTLMRLPDQHVAAVNLAYAGRVIDGDEIWLP